MLAPTTVLWPHLAVIRINITSSCSQKVVKIQPKMALSMMDEEAVTNEDIGRFLLHKRSSIQIC